MLNQPQSAASQREKVPIHHPQMRTVAYTVVYARYQRITVLLSIGYRLCLHLYTARSQRVTISQFKVNALTAR